MKTAFASIAISVAAIALTACQTTPSTTLEGALKQSTLQQNKIMQNTLTAYTWSYQSPQANVKPINLTILDNIISVNAGCNTMNTSWALKQGALVTKVLMTTLVGCSEDLMKNENFAGDFFESREIALRLDQSQPQRPILNLQAKDGTWYAFVGTPTPETKYQSQAETVFFEVKPELKNCTGVTAQKCLEVRQLKYNKDWVKVGAEDWQLLPNIEGYQHNENVRTVLRLKRFTLPNPAADQSKYVYVHDMTVEQEIIKFEN